MSLVQYAASTLELAHQDNAGGLGTDDLSLEQLIERRAESEAESCEYDADAIEAKALELHEADHPSEVN